MRAVLFLFFIFISCEKNSDPCSFLHDNKHINCLKNTYQLDIIKRGNSLVINNGTIKYIYIKPDEIEVWTKQEGGYVQNKNEIKNDLSKIRLIADCFNSLNIKGLNGFNDTNGNILEIFINNSNTAYYIKDLSLLSIQQQKWLEKNTRKCSGFFVYNLNLTPKETSTFWD